MEKEEKEKLLEFSDSAGHMILGSVKYIVKEYIRDKVISGKPKRYATKKIYRKLISLLNEELEKMNSKEG